MRTSILFFVIISFFYLAGCSINVGNQPIRPLEETVVEGEGSNKILILDISGVIGEKPKGPSFLQNTIQPSGTALIKEQLRYAEKDAAVKAIILRIDSPGGEVTETDIIYHELVEFRKRSQKPIIASIMSVGASGAYYLSMAANKVVAHPTSIVGSIGIIMIHVNAAGLLEKIGVKEDSIFSGKFKNMGSPARGFSEEERQIFQDLLDDSHQRFKEIVAKGRSLDMKQVEEFADGRIFTSKQALDYKMIDQIGYLNDAIELAKSEAKIRDAQLILLNRPGDYKASIYSQLNDSPVKVNLVNFDFGSLFKGQSPSLMYLWM